MISALNTVPAHAVLAKRLTKLHLACFSGPCIDPGTCTVLDMIMQVHDLKLPQAPTGAPALNGAPSFVATEALLPHDPRQDLKGLTLQPPPALLPGDTTVYILTLNRLSAYFTSQPATLAICLHARLSVC